MLDFVKKAIFIGAGLASMTADKVQEAVEDFARKGEESEKQGREMLEGLFQKSDRTMKDISERIEKVANDTLTRMNIPTRSHVDELNARIAQLERERMELSARIELLERGGAPGSPGTGEAEAGGEGKV